MHKLLLLLILMGAYMPVMAEPLKIETDSFSLALPDGWSIEELANQAKIVGPNNEYLVLSSYRITGEGDEADLSAIREEFGANIVNTMIQSASEPDLNITTPMAKTNSKNGYPLWSIATVTKDRTQFYALYGAVGKRVALLLTIEGDIQFEASKRVIINAIENIQWH